MTNKDITLRKEAEKSLIQISKKLETKVIKRTAELVKMNSIVQDAEEKYRTVDIITGRVLIFIKRFK